MFNTILRRVVKMLHMVLRGVLIAFHSMLTEVLTVFQVELKVLHGNDGACHAEYLRGCLIDDS